MGSVEDFAELEAKLAEVKLMLRKLGAEAGLDEYIYSAAPVLDTGKFLQTLYQERRIRDDLFVGHGDLFGEPAWDILLDLAINERNARGVSVTSACIASHVPPTTALRWLKILVERGLIARRDDPLDHRRTFLSLTDYGRALLRRFVAKSALLRGAVPGG